MNYDGTPTIDAAGNYLDTYQTINGTLHYYNPTQNYYLVDGVRHPIGTDPGLLAFYAAQAAAPSVSPAPAPPQYQLTFDTIGQVIFRSIGHCRLPLRIIWAQGINESGDVTVSNTQTFAAALCAPIDPTEEIDIFMIWDAGRRVYADGAALSPIGWTTEDAALLATSIAGMVIYPGDELQLPAPLIVADKGAALTNAFRGIRYIIFPDYPIRNGMPNLSVAIERTNDGGEPTPVDDGAVEFLAGSD